MGIHGIYKELGPGIRVAMSKLAVDKFERTGRPFRLAVDVSIWLFQIQSAKGGNNPALRTFYYRILRLMSLSIQPLFVFDGPDKPPVKRNKRTGKSIASIPEYMAKQIIGNFGLPYHTSPGEAEAECALLQKEGVVDAVLSEDVDTLMFGSRVTLKNWSSENSSKVPTHVNMYDTESTNVKSRGLDPPGMILVALMSGGDYLPGGIPGCGPKTACDAARAGLGQELCHISRADNENISAWREKLSYELRTNESNFFRNKHKGIVVPEDFPNREVFKYYTKPAISSRERVRVLADSLHWDGNIDIPKLRVFTADAFDWKNIGGAKKFIRNLAPALLIRALRTNSSSGTDRSGSNTISCEHIKSIGGKRNHVSTDHIPEVRVAFIPIELVPIDLAAESPDEGPIDKENGSDTGEDGAASTSERPTDVVLPENTASTYDPLVIEKVWIPETFVRAGDPQKLKVWEESLVLAETNVNRGPKATSKAVQRAGKSPKVSKQAKQQQGALDRYAVVTKPGKHTHSEKQLQNSGTQTPDNVGFRKSKSPSPATTRRALQRQRRISPRTSNTRKNATTFVDLCLSPVARSAGIAAPQYESLPTPRTPKAADMTNATNKTPYCASRAMSEPPSTKGSNVSQIQVADLTCSPLDRRMGMASARGSPAKILRARTQIDAQITSWFATGNTLPLVTFKEDVHISKERTKTNEVIDLSTDSPLRPRRTDIPKIRQPIVRDNASDTGRSAQSFEPVSRDKDFLSNAAPNNYKSGSIRTWAISTCTQEKENRDVSTHSRPSSEVEIVDLTS